jgi:N-acetylneuraminate synthase
MISIPATLPTTPRVLVIAEAGVNHNGDPALACRLVDAAAEAGADMVKFQTFDARKLAAARASKAAYQTRTTGDTETQLEMLLRLQLPYAAHHVLMARCAERGIGFLSTPFDTDSLRFLAVDLGLDTLKLGSGELTNAPLLLAAARSGARLILSTGMATLAEIEGALGVLAFGMTRGMAEAPSRDAFHAALLDREARATLRGRVVLLHCTTEYPAAAEEANLRAMDTMASAFGLEVGYSDHTEGDAVAIAAVARGATVIEKHFTLDRTMPGPDHLASIEPDGLARLVTSIRQVELALGDGCKLPGTAEVANRPVARKSLCAARDLPAGTVLSPEDIAVKRPGVGLSPFEFWDLIGQRLTVSLAADDSISSSHLR